MWPQTVLCLAIALAVAFPTVAVADAQKHEWFGTWAMNHDGHVGTIRITELKVDCAAPVWCDMGLSYTDARGTRHRGSIVGLDDRFQHLRFQILFPGNTQPFDAYLFSWDKAKLAGTTRWGGRTFGFFATRQ
jgi:hypothetical protein